MHEITRCDRGDRGSNEMLISAYDDIIFMNVGFSYYHWLYCRSDLAKPKIILHYGCLYRLEIEKN